MQPPHEKGFTLLHATPSHRRGRSAVVENAKTAFAFSAVQQRSSGEDVDTIIFDHLHDDESTALQETADRVDAVGSDTINRATAHSRGAAVPPPTAAQQHPVITWSHGTGVDHLPTEIPHIFTHFVVTHHMVCRAIVY